MDARATSGALQKFDEHAASSDSPDVMWKAEAVTVLVETVHLKDLLETGVSPTADPKRKWKRGLMVCPGARRSGTVGGKGPAHSGWPPRLVAPLAPPMMCSQPPPPPFRPRQV